MKIVFAPDSYKGSLSAEKICHLLEETAKKVLGDCETVSLPVSDGGEGACRVMTAAAGGRLRKVSVCGPLGDPVMAEYGIFAGDSAIIEMASASGLPLVPKEKRNVRRASTYGTGELICDALRQGIRKIYLAIGGSATNDGGIGCAAALGIRFRDENDQVLEAVPENLGRIVSIDSSALIAEMAETQVTVLCDVTNPLLGEKGATSVFGPQKGADAETIKFLEAGMQNYAQVLKRTIGYDVAELPGAGAAGGLGTALMAFANARLERGIEVILNLLKFDQVIEGADLIVTGEGRMDEQSAFGKVPFGVGMAAKKKGIPCAAIVGSMGDGAEALYDCGIDSIITTVNGIMEIEYAMEHAEELFCSAAERLFRLILAGRRIEKHQQKMLGSDRENS